MLIYEGISKSGEKVQGRFIGSKNELLQFLKKEQIIVLSIKEYKEKERNNRKIKLETVFMGLEQLYYLLSAGLKIDEAVKLIIQSSHNSAESELWKSILKNLKEGNQLSNALREVCLNNKIYFPEFYLNILSVGEEIGDVIFSLNSILRDIEFKRSLRKEIKNAISYPIFLMLVSLITVVLVSAFILPKFSQIFSESEIKNLPFVSKIVLSVGIYIRENFFILSLFLAGMFLLAIYILSLESTRKFLRKFSFHVPYIGKLLLKLEFSNILSSLSTMMRGGIDLNKAIRLSIPITSNPQIKNILEETSFELKKGRKISETWINYPLIPADVVALISVGENSAKLDEILGRLGEKYMDDFKSEMSQILNFLEPIIIVIVGLFIAFIVIAIFLAVLSISDVF